jgi:hypothetical protein
MPPDPDVQHSDIDRAISNAQRTPEERMKDSFRRLPETQQSAVLKVTTPEEYALLKPVYDEISAKRAGGTGGGMRIPGFRMPGEGL